MFLQSDDNQIQGKKGATGVSIAKAGKCKFKYLIFIYMYNATIIVAVPSPTGIKVCR